MKNARLFGGEEKIFEEFNPEKLQAYVEKARKRGAIEKYFSQGVQKSGLDNLKRIDNEQAIFFGNHTSHFDYLIASAVLAEEIPIERFPHFVAGKSVKSFPFLQFLLPFKYKNSGACWIDRKRAEAGDRSYLRAWKEAVEEKMNDGDNFMIYPQGTRVLRNRGEFDSKPGQGLIKRILNTDGDPYIVSLTVDYDQPIEEPFTELIEWGRGEHRDVPKFVSNAVYRAADIYAYLTRRAVCDRGRTGHLFPWKHDTGRAYFSIGEPKRVSEIVGNTTKKGEQTALIKNYYTSSILRDHAIIQEKKRH